MPRYNRRVRLCNLQNSERSAAATVLKQTTAVGGDMLAMAGLEAEEAVTCVEASAKQLR